jgi:hypothetical protein
VRSCWEGPGPGGGVTGADGTVERAGVGYLVAHEVDADRLEFSSYLLPSHPVLRHQLTASALGQFLPRRRDTS